MQTLKVQADSGLNLTWVAGGDGTPEEGGRLDADKIFQVRLVKNIGHGGVELEREPLGRV